MLQRNVVVCNASLEIRVCNSQNMQWQTVTDSMMLIGRPMIHLQYLFARNNISKVLYPSIFICKHPGLNLEADLFALFASPVFGMNTIYYLRRHEWASSYKFIGNLIVT